MGSAFTPVYPRGSSPMPASVLQSGEQESRYNKRTLKQMALDNIDEEQTADTVPDHVSTSASEASSKGSNNSQPPLLDFIGNTCMASAWFTSCFPCAVVDINDSDDYVVDKLSRESAMNVMYAKNDRVALVSGGRRSEVLEQQDTVIHIQLPEQVPQYNATIDSIPYAIAEDDSQDEDEEGDAMDTISLNDDAGNMSLIPERMESGIGDNRKSPFYEPSEASASVEEFPIYSPTKIPPKKKKFGLKLFGKKKKT